MAEVCRLYVPQDSTVVDVTYGTGRFWRRQPPGINVIAADIDRNMPVDLVANLRKMPFRTASVDVVVLDPPYAHNSGTRNPHDYATTTTRYNGSATTATMYNADIMELYRAGLVEAHRVLRPVGTVLVKCKDEVEREVQRWSHIAIYNMAIELGFCARDLFLLTGTTAPQRWPNRTQRHARKNHSFLWVLQKPDQRYARLLSRTPPSGGVRNRRS
jgi:DNA modification methylase